MSRQKQQYSNVNNNLNGSLDNLCTADPEKISNRNKTKCLVVQQKIFTKEYLFEHSYIKYSYQIEVICTHLYGF